MTVIQQRGSVVQRVLHHIVRLSRQRGGRCSRSHRSAIFAPTRASPWRKDAKRIPRRDVAEGFPVPESTAGSRTKRRGRGLGSVPDVDRGPPPPEDVRGFREGVTAPRSGVENAATGMGASRVEPCAPNRRRASPPSRRCHPPPPPPHRRPKTTFPSHPLSDGDRLVLLRVFSVAAARAAAAPPPPSRAAPRTRRRACTRRWTTPSTTPSSP